MFPRGAWTDVLDQDRAPSEAMERPEGNDLEDEGPEGQQTSKTFATSAEIEADSYDSQNAFYAPANGKFENHGF